MHRVLLSIPMLTIFFASYSQAATITLNDGLIHDIVDGTHSANRLNILDGPGLPPDPTTLNVKPGALINTLGTGIGVDARENSVLNISGGEIRGTGTSGALFLSGDAVATMTGGLVQGGASSARAVEIQGSASLIVLGGTIQGSGSQNRGLETRGANAFARVWGGTIAGFVDIEAREGSLIEVVGTGFNFAFGPLPGNGGTLTGTLSDGTVINWSYGRTSDSTIMLINAATVAVEKVSWQGVKNLYR